MLRSDHAPSPFSVDIDVMPSKLLDIRDYPEWTVREIVTLQIFQSKQKTTNNAFGILNYVLVQKEICDTVCSKLPVHDDGGTEGSSLSVPLDNEI